MIQPERLKVLNDSQMKHGRYVLYWMQASQRARFNYALEYAIERANELDLPLLVFVGLSKHFPRANERHFRFMLEGLRETARACRQRGAGFVVQLVEPAEGAVRLARKAAVAVVDCGYLRIQRQWRKRAAARMRCPLIQVESEVVVPVEVAIPKQAWSAAVLRPRIVAQFNRYLVDLKQRRLKVRMVATDIESLDAGDVDAIISKLKPRRCQPLKVPVIGGYAAAKKLLKEFVETKLERYDTDRNDPTKDGTSRLSPYLHFGQISVIEVALAALNAKGRAAMPFLEELIVRRELAMNFAFYNDSYDSYEGVPDWARKSLALHAADKREYLYTARQFELAQTHDPYWNAAQMEMVHTGRMHGYMRMYWGKKILEWSRTPEEAFEIAVALNDKYELDGRDPNGFAGISWCFGTHDRPWKTRPISGNVRYMNAAGLARKFDADAYVRKINELCSLHRHP